MPPTTSNSKVFKTIENSADITKNKLLLLNKDWDTCKANWQKGISQNGLIGGIKSIFQPNYSKNDLSDEQIQILKNWNNAVKHGCTSQDTFNRIIANADENTKKYFDGLNKGVGSIEDLAKSNAQLSLSAKLGSMGLQTLATAGNMLLMWGVSKGIEFRCHGYRQPRPFG